MRDEWTNQQLQADPEGCLRWQEEQRSKAERERKPRRGTPSSSLPGFHSAGCE